MAAFWRELVGDSQLRWVGPEKGVIHLATAAIVNAVWDLWAKVEGKPLWKLLADMTPGGTRPLHRLPLHHRRAHARRGARHPARRRCPDGRRARPRCASTAIPAYTTSAGWLGYPDDKLRRLCREGLAAGWRHFKIKVGRDLEDDIRRAGIIREEIGGRSTS